MPPETSLRDGETIPRAVLRVEVEGGTVIYGVHFNSSGLGFCRLDDAVKGARDLASKAKGLGLDTDAKAIENAIATVRSAMASAQRCGAVAQSASSVDQVR